MANLANHARLVSDSRFRDRVQASAVQAAIMISGENTDPGNAKSQARQAYAGLVLSDSAPVLAISWAVAANSTILATYTASDVDENGPQSDAVPDGDIEYVMSTVWDDLSGAALLPE